MPTKHRVLVLILTALILMLSWLPQTTTYAESNVKSGLTRSLAAFGIARTLGAGISVVQSIQVGGSVVVASGSVGIGEVLQPLNELVDQFAKVMLAASVSFGIQLVLLKIGGHWAVSGLVSIMVLYAVSRYWKGGTPASRAFQGLLLLLLMVRFAVPVTAVGSETIYNTFMSRGDSTELANMQSVSPSFLGDLSSEPSGEASAGKRSMLARALEAKEALRNAASSWTVNIVHLIASFLVQTVLLPLAFLFILWRGSRTAMHLLAPSMSQIEAPSGHPAG